MKKIFSLFAVFMMILIMMPTTLVRASDDPLKAEQSKTEVMYGALIKDNTSDQNHDSYSAYYSIRQAKYKTGYSLSNDQAPTRYDASAHASDGICKTSSHYSNWSYPAEMLCSGTELNPVAASFSLDDEGTLSITVQNEFEVNRVTVYYIVAGVTENTESDTALLVCNSGGSNSMCSRASYVSNHDGTLSGNWKSRDKRDYGMNFTEYDLEAKGFTLDTFASGRRTYSGYNIIDNMSGLSKNLALKVGAYVIITMSVDHIYQAQEIVNGSLQDVEKRETYYINTPIITQKRFTANPDRRGLDDYAYARSNVQYDPIDPLANGNTVYSERSVQLGTDIEAYAALVSTVEASSDNGIEKFYELFDNILKPVIIIALGILLVIKGSSLIITIIKSSDEPQTRKESIKHLVTLFVSVFVIMMIIWFMKDIIEVVADLISGDV